MNYLFLFIATFSCHQKVNHDIYIENCKKGIHDNVLCINYTKGDEEKPYKKVASIMLKIGYKKYIIFNNNGTYSIVINGYSEIEKGMFCQRDNHSVLLIPDNKKKYIFEVKYKKLYFH